jgi:hypothetical protein
MTMEQELDRLELRDRLTSLMGFTDLIRDELKGPIIQIDREEIRDNLKYIDQELAEIISEVSGEIVLIPHTRRKL